MKKNAILAENQFVKQLRKSISSLIPAGRAKEEIKSLMYNVRSARDVAFSVAKSGRVFGTRFRNLELRTIDPLYHVVADFDFYTHFHKIQPSDVILDAGANRGYVSLFFAMMAGDGAVYAFEPDSKNLELIQKNLELNPSVQNVVTSDLLLWNEDTEIDFCECGSVGSSAHWLPEPDKVVRKKAVSIDSWVRENSISKIDFIKMDIEGAEIEAIDGCRETIKRFSPNFAIASYHIVNGEPTYLKLEKMFQEMGYPFKTIRFKSTEIITFAGPAVM